MNDPTRLNAVFRLTLACYRSPHLLDDVESFRHVCGLSPPGDAEMLREVRGLVEGLQNSLGKLVTNEADSVGELNK
jgi:hypothetical protein